jgi:adenosine kinase
MTALICGSMAYDTIMVFRDRFKNHILPDKVHMLNVSFLVPDMRREFGGCAGNIAYNLKLLGGAPLPMGTVGRDFAPYEEWLSRCGIDGRHLRVIDNAYTAQAFITTDMDDNQITAFHPGAMSYRRTRWAGRHDAARQPVRRGGDPVHFRSGPGVAHVRWRGPDALYRSGELGGRQRLRGAAA